MHYGACQVMSGSEALNSFWGRRVEPTAKSHVFLVYGEACFKDERHPNCTHTELGARPQGKLFALDLERLIGNEWQVQFVACPENSVLSRLALSYHECCGLHSLPCNVEIRQLSSCSWYIGNLPTELRPAALWVDTTLRCALRT